MRARQPRSRVVASQGHSSAMRPSADCCARCARCCSEETEVSPGKRPIGASAKTGALYGTGVALIGPPSIRQAAGGPTNLILSALLAHRRHPTEMYHLAQRTTSAVGQARRHEGRTPPGVVSELKVCQLIAVLTMASPATRPAIDPITETRT
jgi:hypothetical protein